MVLGIRRLSVSMVVKGIFIGVCFIGGVVWEIGGGWVGCFFCVGLGML